jgi:branched-chain amino acid transport system substrate-binding protein
MLIAFLIVTASAGAGGSSAYQVQILASITGAESPQGTAAVNGASTYFDLVNASGGVQGHKIKYRVLDDQSSVDNSQTVGREALDANPTVIVDGSSSGYVTARMPLYQQAQMPVMVVNSPNISLVPWLYAIRINSAQTAAVFVRAAGTALGSLQGKKVAIIAIAVPAGIATANAMTPVIQQAGGSVATIQTFPIGATSFDSGAANIISSGADAVVMVDSTADTIIEAKALLTAGFKGPIIGSSTSSDPLTMAAINSNQYMAWRTEGDVVPGSGMDKAAHKFNHADGLSSEYWVISWAAAYTTVAALKRCKYPCAPADFAAAIQSIGPYTIPGSAFIYGKWKVNKKIHNFPQFAGLVRWDTVTQKAVPVGKPFPVGPPGYTS